MKTMLSLKFLIILLVMIQISIAKAEAPAFDFVSFAELNTQAELTWNHLVKSKGPANAVKDLRESPPGGIQELGQQLQQFLMSSQVHFESLRNTVNQKQIESTMGAKLHPLLRHLLINALLLDIARVEESTKPGFFSGKSHEAHIVRVYYYAFQKPGQMYPVSDEQMQRRYANVMPQLMILARTSALASLLLSVSDVSKCSDILDLGWALQAREEIFRTGIGLRSTPLLAETSGLAMNDLATCFHQRYEAKKIEVQKTGRLDELQSFGNGLGEVFSKKQLTQMAAQLLGLK